VLCRTCVALLSKHGPVDLGAQTLGRSKAAYRPEVYVPTGYKAAPIRPYQIMGKLHTICCTWYILIWR
jgi:hypothetical protein